MRWSSPRRAGQIERQSDSDQPNEIKERAIHRYENDADEFTRNVLLAVRRTFITPFDRGDIRDLITVMDDTIDQMHQTAKATRLYEIRDFEAPMRRMGDIIVQAAELPHAVG